jgi:hypothetical protein
MGQKKTIYPPTKGANTPFVTDSLLQKGEPKTNQNRHDGSCNKMNKNMRPPPKSNSKPVSTTDKQSMAYVTIRNIESETSYLENEWPLFVLKELADNAYDWLNDNYPAKSLEDKIIREIAIRIWITREEGVNNRFVHIAVRHSNVRNIPAFEDVSQIFDFYAWHSTKRNQHRMTTGGLGDALKRCLGMGYASWTSDYNPDETFEEKQWNKPVIIRCNGKEYRVFIKVDTSRQEIWAEIKQEEKPTEDVGNDTEVEVTLPLPKSMIDNDECISRLYQYYKKYKIGKSRTLFSLFLNNKEAK